MSTHRPETDIAVIRMSQLNANDEASPLAFPAGRAP